PTLERFRKPLEYVDGQVEQVVEIDGVRAEQTALVELVGVGNRLVVEGGDASLVLVRPDQLVLRGRDLRMDPARDEALRVALELLEAGLRQPDLVGLVVDREVRPVTEPGRLAPKNPAAGGVKGEDPEPAGGWAEQVFQPLLHLIRGLVRERDRKDLVRLDAAGSDEVADAVREHARLAGAGAGDYEQRALGFEHGLALSGVQVGEVALGRGNGHPL